MTDAPIPGAGNRALSVFIVVCPFAQVEALVARRRPTHLVTILDPGAKVSTPRSVDRRRHLKLSAHDVGEAVEGKSPPDEALVARLIAFGRDWEGASPLLVHCWAGIGRSTAAAFVLLCDKNPGLDEARIAAEIRRQSRYASPNRLIVAHADRILGRQGRMIAAIEAIGRGDPIEQSQPFELRTRFEPARGSSYGRPTLT